MYYFLFSYIFMSNLYKLLNKKKEWNGSKDKNKYWLQLKQCIIVYKKFLKKEILMKIFLRIKIKLPKKFQIINKFNVAKKIVLAHFHLNLLK